MRPSSRKHVNFPLQRVAAWLPIFVFLGIFFFFPMGKVLFTSLDLSGLGIDDLHLTTSRLAFTFFQAFLSTFLTLILGIPTAFLFSRFDFPGKRFLRTMTAIPFILPTVVVAAGFNAWLGPRGWLNLAWMRIFDLELPPIMFLGTLGAILLAHIFYNATIVIRILENAISRLDPCLEQAARTLGADPWKVIRKVTFPLLIPPLLSAALLVFLFDFSSFGVILLLGGPQFSTLEVEIYLQAIQLFNLPMAAWLSLVQLLCTLSFSVLYSRFSASTRIKSNPGINQPARPKRFIQRLMMISLSGILIILFVFPLISLPIRSFTRLEADTGQRGEITYGWTTDYYTELFINRNNSVFYVPPVEALGNSIIYAVFTAIAALLLGFPAALALARPGIFERVIDPLLMLPLGASAVTLGLGYILSFGTYLTSPILVPIAHAIIALPFVIRTLQPILASIPEGLKQVAATLGASPQRVWKEVDWPLVRKSTLSAGIFAFTISLGEFGATVLLYRPEFPTLPTAIYRFLSQPGGQNYGQAMAMATILMVVAGVGILIFERIRIPGSSDF